MNAKKKILEIISEETSWKQLNSKLFSSGLVSSIYEDRQKFVELIRLFWENNCTFVERPCHPIPGRIVGIKGSKIYIHGLPHDAPLTQLPPEFKEGIKGTLKGFEIICEDGFSDWLPDATSFEEIRYFNLGKTRAIPSAILGLIHARLFRGDGPLKKQVRELNGVDDFLEFRKVLFKSYLPEPLGMNSLLYERDLGTIDSPKGEIPLSIKRYTYEASKAIRHARERTLETHVVVGCAHERPLEYLITHPEILRNYECVGRI